MPRANLLELVYQSTVNDIKYRQYSIQLPLLPVSCGTAYSRHHPVGCELATIQSAMEHDERRCCRWRVLLEFVLVLVTSLCYAAKVCLLVYSWWGDPGKIALKVSLPSAFLSYGLPISPPQWTHVLWLVIFAWEGLWLVQSWVLLCKQRSPRIIFPGFYLMISLACLLHIGWLFAWARLFPELALGLVALLILSLLACVAMLTGYLYYIRGNLKFYYTCNFRLTRLLALNATVAYATFSIILTLYTLGAVLVDSAEVAEVTVSTILLSLLSSLMVTYFLLENTILDRFLRYVFAVYPVILWTLAGILVETWEGVAGGRNQLFALVLACVTGALILVRTSLWLLYWLGCRPLPDYKDDEPELLPQ